MKNFHKVRGKREFLFDDRELLVLGSGAAIICVLIFILGLMVGQTLSEQSVASPMGMEETSIDVGIDGGSEHSFAGEEMDFSDDSAERVVAEPLDDKPETRSSEQSYFKVLPDNQGVVQVEATPARVSNPEPEAAPQAAAPPQAAPEQPAAPPQQVAQPVTPIPPSGNNTAPGQPQNMAAVPALPNVPRDPSDSIQVGRQPAARTSSSAQIAPGGTIFSVQVASSPKREDSERLVRKFGEHGYQAYVMLADLGDKGIWYRVRVGDLPNRAEALILKAELEQRLPKLANSPYVIKVSE